jgi:Transposase IS116/IS110/IS902 family
MTKSGRHRPSEAQSPSATATTPAIAELKSKCDVPGSKKTTAAKDHMKIGKVVRQSNKKGRQLSVEAQVQGATSTPAKDHMKPSQAVPGSFSSVIEAIRAHHRERRFAMGIQQVLDRKLESFIRINKTDWHVLDDDETREKANKEVDALIKRARKGEGDPSIILIVGLTDKARAPADAERKRHELEMESLAEQLAVAAWVKSVPGFGLLGLATIIAETGDLANYPNVAKVSKRLGYAPYDGLAGSSWKREKWRNGRPALTPEQWIENPFSGRRYALIHMISLWLKNKQWIGAKRTDDGVGKPNGYYGEVYATRRAHTAQTHPDWSKKHSHMDGLRIMMKEVLKDLWFVWNNVERKPRGPNSDSGRQSSVEAHNSQATATPAMPDLKPTSLMPGSPIENGRQLAVEAQRYGATATPATQALKPANVMPGSPLRNGRHCLLEAHPARATATPADPAVKPTQAMPGSPIHGNGRHLMPEAPADRATATPANRAMKSKGRVPGSPITESGRCCANEAQEHAATATPVTNALKPSDEVPGSSFENGRQPIRENPTCDATATPAILLLKPIDLVPGSPLEQGRQTPDAIQNTFATAIPAGANVKPTRTVPGSPLKNGRHKIIEAQSGNATATPAIALVKPNAALPGSPIENGRQLVDEAQRFFATATPASAALKPRCSMPGSPLMESEVSDAAHN